MVIAIIFPNFVVLSSLRTHLSMSISPSNKYQRASSLDVLKCLAAFFIVWTHCGYGSKMVLPVIRTAVPLFFLITGYYYPMLVHRGRMSAHLLKMVRMAFLAVIFYLVCFGEWWLGNVAEWLMQTFSKENVKDWLLFNDVGTFSPLMGHLWYFFAVIYGLVLMIVLDRLRMTGILYAVSPLLFCFLVGYDYCDETAMYVRNFLFYALPFLLIGRFLREKGARVVSLFTGRKVFWMVVAVSVVLSYCELMMRLHGPTGGNREIYIFTLPLIVAVFCMALRHPLWGKNSWAALLGRCYSAYIYIFHMFIADYGRQCVDAMGKNVLSVALLPFIVFGLSLLFSVVYVWAKKKILNLSIF